MPEFMEIQGWKRDYKAVLTAAITTVQPANETAFKTMLSAVVAD
jgi:hypothetical protein